MADASEAKKEPVKKEPTKSEKRRSELKNITDALLRAYTFSELMGCIQDAIESQDITEANEKRKALRRRQIRVLRVGAALMDPENDDKRIFMIKPDKPIVFPPLG